MKKISDLRFDKEISRMRLDQNRNRYYENVVFNLRYNPVDKEVLEKRSTAKFIDVLVGVIISFVYLIFFYNGKWDYLDLISLTILITFFINSVLEFVSGKSIGKYFKKISVIDDFGNKPTLLKSFKRNFLSLVHVLSGFQFKPAWAIEPLPIGKNTHNEICKTYVVNDSKLGEIKELLNEK